jgi:MFS family permease
MTTTPPPTLPREAKRNLALLILCQGLLFVNNTTMIAINGLAGLAYAPNALLATVPITGYVVGGAVAAMPVSWMMKHWGRQAGFSVGTLFGMLGALLCALAAYLHSFNLLCCGTFLVGFYNACGTLYRFAATDVAPPSFKEKAISWVLAGGILGGIVGPNLARVSKDALATPFMGAYLALTLFGLAALIVIRFLRFPPVADTQNAKPGRPLAEIFSQPAAIVALMGGAVGYGVMNLLMTATPLAMQMCKHPFAEATFVLEWHVIAMFAPSFFTGSLIKRFGVLPVMLVGAMLMFVCVGVALGGVEVMQFLVALMALGVGWNFLFVGGTTLLTECYRPEEKNKVQGMNDLVIFLTMATSSFSSGALVTTQGWTTLNIGSLPFLVIVSAAIVWLMFKRRSAPVAA